MKLRFFSLFLSCSVQASLVKVAVIDTGLSKEFHDSNLLCKDGIHDFIHEGLSSKHKENYFFKDSDHSGHGTNTSFVIDSTVKGITIDRSKTLNENLAMLNSVKADYCQYIIVGLTGTTLDNHDISVMDVYLKALEKAISLKPDIINISGGSSALSIREAELIKQGLDDGIIFIVAAGNDNKNLSPDAKVNKGEFYPAMVDPRIIVVGSMLNNVKAVSSNYGSVVDEWRNHGIPTLGRFGSVDLMWGTSAATPVVTGEMVNRLILKKKRDKNDN